jgi:2-keto-4-pentenoate hydratase
MQKLCGVEEPCYGAMFAREVYHRRTELSAREYCRIAAETEIALRLGDDLPQDGDRSRIAAAVVSAMAAIELIEDLRYDYRRLDAAAMVADNVWYAEVVPAAPVSEWRALDLARVTARPSINGREIGSGKWRRRYGPPVECSRLARGQARCSGDTIAAMIVMTGNMVPIQYLVAGDRALVEISGLGAAELAVT